MQYLIVNADDFGLHPAINDGIIKGWRDGFITSTSLMCGAPAFEDAVEKVRNLPLAGRNGLALGIHLTLVGKVAPVLPAEEVPGLVGEDGLFPASYPRFAFNLYLGKTTLEEVQAELEAQIEKALATGLHFTHLDSHQHLHVLPGMQNLVLRLCRIYGFKAVRVPAEAYGFTGGFDCGPVRTLGKWGLTFLANRFRKKLGKHGILCPDHFFGMAAGGHLDSKLVGNILEQLPEGTSEIMTHPGADSGTLKELFPWGYHWEDELEAFTSAENRTILEERNIRLVNFAGLSEIQRQR